MRKNREFENNAIYCNDYRFTAKCKFDISK